MFLSSEIVLINKRVCCICRSSHTSVFCLNGIRKNFANSQETPVQKSLFLEIFITKETPIQVVFCEFCEIFKNTIFCRTPPVAASVFMKLIFDFLQNLDTQSCHAQIGNKSKVTIKNSNTQRKANFPGLYKKGTAGLRSGCFIGTLAVAERVLQNRVCPSFRLSFGLSGHFLGIVSLVFSKFWHCVSNPYEVVRDSWIFWK